MRIGYVSNIMARFWKAPLFGAQLESDLQTEDYVSNFRSHLGNTTGPLEPHEWGWFWRHWLRLKGNNHYCTADAPPDVDELGRIFASLEALKSAPLIFDSVFGMVIHATGRPISRTAFLHVDYRNVTPIDTVLTARGWLRDAQDRKAFVNAELRGPDGTVLAEAHGLMIRLLPGQP